MKATHHFPHTLQRQVCDPCDYKMLVEASQLVSPFQKVEDSVVGEVEFRQNGVVGEFMASGIVWTRSSIGIYYIVRCSSSHPNTPQKYQTKSPEMLKKKQ